MRLPLSATPWSGAKRRERSITFSGHTIKGAGNCIPIGGA